MSIGALLSAVPAEVRASNGDAQASVGAVLQCVPAEVLLQPVATIVSAGITLTGQPVEVRVEGVATGVTIVSVAPGPYRVVAGCVYVAGAGVGVVRLTGPAAGKPFVPGVAQGKVV
jgi:hypothetical protein